MPGDHADDEREGEILEHLAPEEEEDERREEDREGRSGSVRDSVWLIASLTRSAKVWPFGGRLARFSRIRSKTTMVSLIE